MPLMIINWSTKKRRYMEHDKQLQTQVNKGSEQ